VHKGDDDDDEDDDDDNNNNKHKIFTTFDKIIDSQNKIESLRPKQTLTIYLWLKIVDCVKNVGGATRKVNLTKPFLVTRH